MRDQKHYLNSVYAILYITGPKVTNNQMFRLEQ